MSAEWHKTCYRRFILGHHIPDYDQPFKVSGILAKVDPARFVRELKKAGVEVFQIYAKCHYGNAYYPTAVGHKHSAIGDRDLFREYISACRREGIIPVCIYEWLDHRVRSEHPEWDRFFSPYREFSKQQVAEIVSGYDIDGLYMDMVDFKIDRNSPGQQEAYRQEFNRDIPARDWESDQWRECVRWAYRQARVFLQEIRDIAAKHRPALTVTHNLHISPDSPYDWGNGLEESCAVDDFAWNDTFGPRDGYLTVSAAAKLFKSISKLTPEILVDSFVDVLGQAPDCHTAKSQDAYLAEAMTLAANGVAFQSGMMLNHDGTWNKTILKMIRQVNREVARVQPVVRDSRPFQYAAIVFSERTRDFYGRDDVLLWARSFYGMFGLLQACHLPFDVIPDTRLTAESLSGYQALVLPSIACLSDSTAAVIREFARGGGVVIATDRTSALDENGREREKPALADLFGVDFQERLDGRDLFIEPTPEFACREKLISFPERAAGVLPSDRVRTICHTRFRQHKEAIFLAISDRGRHPFAVAGKFGRGQSIYIAGDLGSGYIRTMHPEYRQLFRKILGAFLKPLFRIEAPCCIEAVFSENPADQSINLFLINLQVDMKRAFFRMEFISETAFAPFCDEILPVRNVKVSCALPNVRAITDIATGKPLPLKRKSGEVCFTVPSVKIYRAIKILRDNG